MLFKSLLEIKIDIESRLHNIDIYDDDECRKEIQYRAEKRYLRSNNDERFL